MTWLSQDLGRCQEVSWLSQLLWFRNKLLWSEGGFLHNKSTHMHSTRLCNIILYIYIYIHFSVLILNSDMRTTSPHLLTCAQGARPPANEDAEVGRSDVTVTECSPLIEAPKQVVSLGCIGWGRRQVFLDGSNLGGSWQYLRVYVDLT